MNVSSVNNKSYNAERIGKRVGTAAGFAGYPLYVLKKQGKSAFTRRAEEAVQRNISPKLGVAIQAASIAGVAIITSIAGRIIGGLIGKAADKIAEKKAISSIEEK